jgi:hypothetical protein
LNRLHVLTGRYGRITSEGTCGRTELDNFLRSKMRFVDDEKDFYFVFSLSNLGPGFWVLTLRYTCTLGSGAFLAEAYLRSISKLRKCGLA